MSSLIPEGLNTAVVLMTHNYEADLEIMQTMVRKKIGYMGCIGPAQRWQSLKADLLKFHKVSVSTEWEQIVHAPAGIFTRGKNPSDIAISIVAQVQKELLEKPGTNFESNWTLLLAAGESRRFGSAKFLAPWQETNLLDNAVKKAQSFSENRVVIVTGAWHNEMQPWLKNMIYIKNECWTLGMGTSIAVGINEILRQDPKASLITILPLDQPLVSLGHLQELQKLAQLSGRVALTGNKQTIGPPAVVPARFFELARSLQGDSGLRSILPPDEWVALGSAHALTDIDTRAQLDELA
jgi:molybdenum cofactor cytidylyltransferase